jgi:hypothetical protein
MPDNIKNVFISHIHEDDAGLGRLKDLLQTRGYSIRDASITSDRPNEAKNEAYIKSSILAPGINWAGTMIVYISPATRDSTWVNWEIEYAERQGKRIIGVWAHGANECDVPPALDLYADAVVGWNADRIVAALEGDLRNWETPTGDQRAEREIARFSCG